MPARDDPLNLQALTTSGSVDSMCRTAASVGTTQPLGTLVGTWEPSP